MNTKYLLNYYNGEIAHTVKARYDVFAKEVITMVGECGLDADETKEFDTYEEAMKEAAKFVPYCGWAQGYGSTKVLEAKVLEIERAEMDEDDDIIESEIIDIIAEGCFVDPYEEETLFEEKGVKVYTEYGYIYLEDGENTVELKNNPDNQADLVFKAQSIIREREQ